MEWRAVEEPQEAKLWRFGEKVPEEALHKPGFVVGDAVGIIAGIIVALVLGSNLISGVLLLFSDMPQPPLTAGLMWINSVLLLVVFGALPFAWIAATRRGGWSGTWAFFQLRRPWTDGPVGLGLAVGLIILIAMLGLIMQAAGYAPENPAIESLSAILNWPLIIAISLSAALGEEILFRGVIQRHIGLWPQAAVFGFLHAYQGFYGVILTTALAVLFGYIVKRRWGLWIPIVAHFFFDFIQLALLMIVGDLEI